MTDYITPPQELVKQWQEAWYRSKVKPAEYELYIANCAAQWGADAELEACCEWLVSEEWFKYEHEAMEFVVEDLRATRRPKPSSLKEQALAVVENSEICDHVSIEQADILRRALEALDD